VLAFLLGLALLVVTAGLGAAALRLRGCAAFLLAAWVLACAELVLAGELLSLLGSVGRTGYALVETTALVLATGAWLASGSPRPALPRPGRPGLLLALLGVVVACGLGYETFLVLTTPPNNWDSMHYHLARVAAWRGQGSLDWFGTHNGIENTYPPDGELLVLWAVVLAGRDAVAALPQLAAQLATALAVFGIARRLGYGARSSAFAALLFPTLTIVALESVTTQNDLVEASFVAAAVCFALGRTRAETALAGAALGLAVGTKLSIVFAAPVLLAVFLLAVPRRRAVAAWSAAGIALLGSYGYVQNLVEDRSLLGGSHETTLLRPEVTLGGTASTVARTTYRLVDLSGWHPKTALVRPIGTAAQHVFAGLHIPPNPPEATTSDTFPFDYAVNTGVSEDASGFGPLGFLLLLPLSLGFLVAWALRRTGRRHAALALALPLYVLALALGTRWNFYAGRFLVTPIALTLPLAAPVVARRWLAAPILVLAAVTFGVAHAFNPSKAAGFEGTTAIWNLDRVAAQTVRRPKLEPVFRTVAERVPTDARIGVSLARSDWEYPLYGPRLRRRLVFLPARGALADADGLDWVVLGDGIDGGPAPGWCRTRFPRSGWTLAHRDNRGTCS
jgi:hypothetical protein